MLEQTTTFGMPSSRWVERFLPIGGKKFPSPSREKNMSSFFSRAGRDGDRVWSDFSLSNDRVSLRSVPFFLFTELDNLSLAGAV